MNKVHRSAPVFFQATQFNLDSENGIIKDVVIVQSGKNKYGDNIDTTFLDQIAKQGNSQGQGVKSRFGHPNMCDTTLGTFIGRYRNFRVAPNTDGKQVVLADLHLDQASKQSPKGNLYDYVLNMSKTNNDMFGNSIVYSPAEKEVKKEMDEAGLETKVAYERVKSFIASDLVDSPAATDSLFRDSDDFASLTTQFLDENPSIYEVLSKHPLLLKEFLTKYEAYKKEKEMSKPKSILQKIRELIGTDKSNEAFTTSDGKTINVDGGLSVGSLVTDDAGNPTPSASYTLADGTKISTDADSKITSVTPPAQSNEMKELEELKQKHSALEAELKKVQDEKTALEAETKQNDEKVLAEVEKLKAENTKLSAEVVDLKSKITSTHTVATGQTSFSTSNSGAVENKVEEAARRRKEREDKKTKTTK